MLYEVITIHIIGNAFEGTKSRQMVLDKVQRIINFTIIAPKLFLNDLMKNFIEQQVDQRQIILHPHPLQLDSL